MRRRNYMWLMGGLVAAALWCGCGGDARLAGRKLRTPTVRSVTHYGMTLNSEATPQQVAYVLLRAIRDDVQAVTPTDRDSALDKQFDLCAANVIADRNKTSVPRDQFVHNVVYHWAATVAHYAGDFPPDWESAKARLMREQPVREKDGNAAADESEVALVVNDPSGDARATVVVQIWMARDGGYWRVTHLGFDPTRRSLGNSE